MKFILLAANSAAFLFALLAPVLIAFGLVATRWKAPAALRISAMRFSLISVLFGLSDWGLLAAMPHLKLSYGQLAVPLVAWLTMRCLFFMVWAVVSRSRQSTNNGPSPVKSGFILFNLALTLLLLYGFYFEPFNLGITSLEHTVEQPGFQPLRIMHLTDLHLERITKREQRLISLVEDQKPDIILLTGDYLNTSNLNDLTAVEQARQVLASLKAPLGVYAVSGNVDRDYHMQVLFEGLDITVLDDEILEVPRPNGNLHLVGVSNRGTERDAAQLSSLMETVPADAFSVLLYHTPDLIKTAAQTGVDLYFAGHTHGGQIRLPFYGALITFSRHGKRFEMGDYQVEGTRLYVSRGLGMEGSIAPRVRFLCPPEITIMDIKGSQ